MKLHHSLPQEIAQYAMALAEWISIFFILCLWWEVSTPLWMSVVFLSLAYAGSAFVRYHATHLPFLIAGHSIVALLFVAYEKIHFPIEFINYHVGDLTLLITLIMLIFSLSSGISEWKSSYVLKTYEEKYYFLIGPIILYIYSAVVKNSTLEMAAVVLSIILILLHLWCLYLQGLSTFLTRNRDFDNLPAGKIIAHNNAIMSIILGSLAILLLISCFFESDHLFLLIGEGIVRLLILIIMGIFKAITFILNLIFSDSFFHGFDQFMRYMSDLLYSGSTNRFLNTLYYIFGYLCLAYLLFLAFRGMKRYFNQEEIKKSTETVVGTSSIEPDKIESLETPKTEILHPRTEKEKIRFRYRKLILNAYKKRVPDYKTAQELTENLVLNKKNSSEDNMNNKNDSAKAPTSTKKLSSAKIAELKELTSQYDDARYN